MEQKHKDLIQNNFVDLIELTNWCALLPAIRQKDIFANNVLDNFDTMTDREKKRKFYIDIQKRGPDAFKKLIDACLETNQYNIYNILTSNQSIINNITKYDGICCGKPIPDEDCNDYSIGGGARPFQHPLQLEHSNILVRLLQTNINIPYVVSLMEESIYNIPLQLSDNWMDQPTDTMIVPYSTRGQLRGVALIINYINFMHMPRHKRIGADVDAKRLIQMFTKFNIAVRYFEDLSKNETINKLNDFVTNDPLLDKADSCFTIIMSHGQYKSDCFEATQFMTSDLQMIDTFAVQDKFTNQNCPKMKLKPKVMVFQMCRGKEYDFGINSTLFDGAGTAHSIDSKLTYASDILTVFSAYPGFVSHRDPKLGAWIIECMYDVFMRHAHNTDVQKLFKIIEQQVSQLTSRYNTKQATEIRDFGFRLFYLHPGLPKHTINNNENQIN